MMKAVSFTFLVATLAKRLQTDTLSSKMDLEYGSKVLLAPFCESKEDTMFPIDSLDPAVARTTRRRTFEQKCDSLLDIAETSDFHDGYEVNTNTKKTIGTFGSRERPSKTLQPSPWEADITEVAPKPQYNGNYQTPPDVSRSLRGLDSDASERPASARSSEMSRSSEMYLHRSSSARERSSSARSLSSLSGPTSGISSSGSSPSSHRDISTADFTSRLSSRLYEEKGVELCEL